MGGYGTFGGRIAHELAAAGLRVTIAGRNRQRAERAAETLGDLHRGIAADVTDAASCRAAIEGQRVVVNAAGPFSRFESTLLDACLDAGCHYVDIADDRDYVARVRGRAMEFEAAGLSAVVGCSSLPGISGAVAALLCEQLAVPIDRVRITLFIGNRNSKGLAAVQSAAASIGQPIQLPQGVLMGFGDSEHVALYAPFGNRRVLNFSSPDYDLLPALVPPPLRPTLPLSVSVKVGFELWGVTAALAFAARWFPRFGRWMMPRLVPLSGLLGWVGSSGGQVMVELFAAGAVVRRGAVVALSEGQRMAVLPAVYAATALSAREPATPGVVTAYEAIGARNLIDMLIADGFEFRLEEELGQHGPAQAAGD